MFTIRKIKTIKRYHLREAPTTDVWSPLLSKERVRVRFLISLVPCFASEKHGDAAFAPITEGAGYCLDFAKPTSTFDYRQNFWH